MRWKYARSNWHQFNDWSGCDDSWNASHAAWFVRPSFNNEKQQQSKSRYQVCHNFYARAQSKLTYRDVQQREAAVSRS